MLSTRRALLAATALLPVAVAACSGSQPAASVVVAEKSLAAAGRISLGYLQLPVCSGSNGPVCGNATTRTQIKMAFDSADDAVKAADAAVQAGGTPNMTAVNAAIAGLQGVLASLPPSVTASLNKGS